MTDENKTTARNVLNALLKGVERASGGARGGFRTRVGGSSQWDGVFTFELVDAETGEVVELQYLQLALLAGGLSMLMLLVWIRGAAVLVVPDEQGEPYATDDASEGLGPKP